MPSSRLLPVLGLLTAATLWGVFWYPLRLLEAQGLSGLWSSLFLYAGTAAAWPFLLRGRMGEWRRAPLWLLLVALGSGWTNIAFVLAMLEGEVMRVLLLFYLSPLWATVLGWLFLHERIDGATLGILAVAVAGAVIMLWNPALGLPWPASRADWLALSSGFAFAALNTVLRHLQGISVQVKTVAGWLGVVVMAGILLLAGQEALAASLPAVGAALGLGATFLVLMTLSVVYGVTHMPVQRSAVILLFEIVAGAVSSMWLTDERLSPAEWFGGALVILAAWLSARRAG